MSCQEKLITHGNECQFPAEPSDQELIAFVEKWIDLLAARDYESAFHATWQDSYFQWSPSLLEAVINGYGLPEPRRDGAIFSVSNRREAKGSSPEAAVEHHDLSNGVWAEVRHDLPLNGEWSDLTATFHVLPAISGFAVVLQEIHVF